MKKLSARLAALVEAGNTLSHRGSNFALDYPLHFLRNVLHEHFNA
jgi:hypothetical protein